MYDLQLIEHFEKFLKQKDELIKDAITLMDERGRRNEGSNSYLLWNMEWQALRATLLKALEIAKPR